MDVHGGKGICLGPKNYLGRNYQIVPVAITVEGANILTRSLIIFGQGAVRCHPWVLKEMNAARNPDREKGVLDFDKALLGHIGYALSNAARSIVMAMTFARFTRVPVSGPTRRYFQHINRYSASFSFAADVAMLALGGYLKKKETLSARLGDVLSMMYLASMVLKHHANQGSPKADLPLIDWACRSLLYQAQEQLHQFLRNFPNRMLAALMRLVIFPRGLTYFPPSDRSGREIAKLVMTPGEARERLCAPLYNTLAPHNPLGLLQEVLVLAEAAEALEKRIRVEGVKTGKITSLDLPGQIRQALQQGILLPSEADTLTRYDAKVMDLLNVDDFSPQDIGTQRGAT
jgi:acyl-CoA dehydrogenase